MSPASPESSAVKRGQELTTALASAVRTAGYYDPGNAVMQRVGQELLEMLRSSPSDRGAVSFGVHSHSMFVNKARVPATVSTYGRFESLMKLFEDWHVDTIAFQCDISEHELMQALMLLSREGPSETEDLADMLSARGIEKIFAEVVDPGTGDESRLTSPLLIYAAAMHLGVQLSGMKGSIDPATVRRARHVTQNVVDEILRDPTSLMTLTSIKDFDRYLILHSTNVAVLATILGQRLGLSKQMLGELCLAGFLHDAGKLGVDPDVLNKPGALDQAEWEEMQRHPVMAANSLLAGQRLTPSTMRSVVVAFEHHLNHDLSGYPPVRLKKSLSLFGGIVAIADVFDALTTARVYRKVNLTPPEAVVILVKDMGTKFEPVLIKLFVEVMGVYPTGTVVVLGSGEAGVVCKPPSIGTYLDRPHVRLIIGENPGTVVDLQERVRGRFKRSIIGVLNPSNKGQIPAVDPAVLSAVV